MRITVIGLGIIGTVTAACLAGMEQSVIGLDINSEKVDLLNRGRSLFVEASLQELFHAVIEKKEILRDYLRERSTSRRQLG